MPDSTYRRIVELAGPHPVVNPREVKLPGCPKCGRVSNQAEGIYSYGVSYYCVGTEENRHRKAKMRPVLFREVAAP